MLPFYLTCQMNSTVPETQTVLQTAKKSCGEYSPEIPGIPCKFTVRKTVNPRQFKSKQDCQSQTIYSPQDCLSQKIYSPQDWQSPAITGPHDCQGSMPIPGDYYSPCMAIYSRQDCQSSAITSSENKYCPARLTIPVNYWLKEQVLSGKIWQSPAITVLTARTVECSSQAQGWWALAGLDHSIHWAL